MNNTSKKLFALLMAVIMVVSMLPVSALNVAAATAGDEVKYTFSSYTAGTQYAQGETHVLDDTVTLTINGAHLNEQVRLYSGSNAVLAADGLSISKIVVNAGYKAGTLTVYSSADGSDWSTVAAQTTTTSYTDYTLDLPTGTTQVKLESTGAQIRVKYATLTFAEDSTSGCDHADATVTTVDPSCTEDGSTTTTCSCGYSKTTTIAALGHSYVDGKCSVCGTDAPKAVATLINSAEDFVTGEYVMITSKGYAPGVLDGTWVTAVQPVVVDDSITDAAGGIWTLTVADSTVTIKDANGVFIAPTAADTNGITSGEYSWTWSVGEDGTFTFAGESVKLASNASSSYKFRAYKDSTTSSNTSGYQVNFSLYKVVTACEEHSWNEGEVTTAPGCETAGEKTYTCTVCGETKTEAVDAAGHSYEAVVTAPTCTEAGYTTHTCSACGDSYTDTPVDATGHSWNDGEITTAPGCESEGVKTFTCGTCGETKTEAVDAAGHSYEAVVTAPTCTEAGYTTHTCSACGDSYTDTPVDATGHSWNDGEITTAPGCESEGVKTFTCGTCGETKTEAVDAAGHSYEAVVTAPTCTEAGYTTHTCSACGDSYTDTPVDATGHSWNEGVITTEPTCETEGVKTFTCGTCGETKTEVVAGGHAIEYVAEVIPANCQENGHSEYWYCAGCDSYFGDAEGSYQINPAWLSYTGEHVRPEDAIVCAVVPCELCGEDSYGEACDRGDAPVCQDTSCVNCGETVYGWGCNYNTGDEEVSLPLCQPGDCVYCGTHYEKLYDCENGAWAPCQEGECSYGCGKTYPATAQHTLANPCEAGNCTVCWSYIEALHVYDEGVITTEPTFESEGVKTYTCSECGATKTEAVAKLEGITGTGTAEDPYVISNLDLLKWFRDDVNAGNSYSGKFVALGADIDLGNEEWTPIGNSTNKFQGTFDGQDHTISNLYINQPSTSYVGLFGFTTNGAIKNLTLENANVTGRLGVGAVAGSPYTSKYSNITLTGHVEINGMAYVGGVGGRNAYASWDNITVDVDETSYVKANSVEDGVAYRTYVGGVIGFNGEGNHTYTNITSNIDVIGSTCDIGGIFGIIHYSNTVENVACSASVTSEGEADEIGGIAGVWHNAAGYTVTINNASFTGTVSDVNGAVENVEIVGAAYNADNSAPSNSGSLIIDGQEAWVSVATIGDTKYQTLADAFANAQDGDTIVVTNDIALDASISNTKEVTLDLNGKTITGTDNTEKNFGLINNTGILTIDDSVGGGKITLTSTVNSGWNRYAAVISNNPGGTLIVENGTIENLGGTDMAYGIDSLTNGNIGAVSVTINGGVIKSTYRAIRQFLNSATTLNELTINGGTVEGVSNGVFFHDPSTKANLGALTIGENASVSGVYLFVTAGSTEWPVQVSISAAAVPEGGVTSKNVPEDYAVVESNGVIGVVEVPDAAQIGETGYKTLADAFAAAQDGDTITVLTDIETNETYTVADGVSITLDLNGKTITATDEKTSGNYELFYIRGEMTVTGNGTVELTATDRDWNAASSVFHNRGGVLTIENGSFTHLGGTDMAYVVDNSGNSYGDATTNINGGSLTSSYIGIRNRMDIYGANGGGNGIAILNITAGEISGKYAVWGQVSSTGCKGEINISGGKLSGWTDKVALLVDADETGEIKTAVSGGIFSSAVLEEYCAEGFIPVANEDGTYGVFEGSYVAQIGDVKYADLQAALNVGGEIVILEDIVLTDTVTVPAGVAATLNLNGKTISQEKACTASYSMIVNKGELTITGDGKISFTDTGAGDPKFGWGSYTLTNSGTLVVESGTIENLSAQNQGSVVHMYCAIQQSAGTTTINGGTISTPTYRSIRVNKGDLIINGGNCEGQIWLQPNQGDVTLNITGGSFAPRGVDGSSVFMTNSGEGYTVSSAAITGGYFATKIGCSDADALAGCITGGTYTYDAVSKTNPALLATGFGLVQNSDGTFNVVAAPERPTATVTELDKEDLTFALNFVADSATDEQLAYYGAWYADFVLKLNKDVTFNANGGADGYLSGQYDAWSENWVSVPFEDVTLAANTELKIMEYAAQMMGQSGLKLTYADVYDLVKNFNCGVAFTPEFLKANPDLVVTLELRMYNYVDESESYTIGETYTFEYEIPELPTATITETENDDLTFSMNFKTDEATDEQLFYYGDWYADFVLKLNKEVTFNANGGADGYLSGQYDAWSENWVNVPFEDVTLAANTELRIMEYAAQLMGKTGLKYTYKEVYEFVKDFDCGVLFTNEYLMANPDLVVTLELRMYNNLDESESYVIGETYVFTNESVAYNVEKDIVYNDLIDALEAAAAGETVKLLKNVDGLKSVTVYEETTLDLNGYSLTAQYYSCFGDTVDNSEANTGLLNVAANRILMEEDNAQIAVRTANGYMFFQVIKMNSMLQDNGAKYIFQPVFEEAAHQYLLTAEGLESVKIKVNISWTNTNGIARTQVVEYDTQYVETVLNSYNAATGKYDQAYYLTLVNASYYDNLEYVAYVYSELDVSCYA